MVKKTNKKNMRKIRKSEKRPRLVQRRQTARR